MILSIIGVLVMGASLLLIPIGVPGTWIMVVVLVLGAAFGDVGVATVLFCLVIAAAAEVVEFFIVRRLNIRYGGSSLAFWGAIFGGIAGVVVGMPIPIIGSIIAGFVGSIIGAAGATIYETRRFDTTLRVGWGVLLGRMWSAVAKVTAGIIIFVLGSAALLLR